MRLQDQPGVTPTREFSREEMAIGSLVPSLELVDVIVTKRPLQLHQPEARMLCISPRSTAAILRDKRL